MRPCQAKKNKKAAHDIKPLPFSASVMQGTRSATLNFPTIDDCARRVTSNFHSFQYLGQIKTMSSTTLHVRAETKPLEHRSAVTPAIAKQLVDAGYNVNVERSKLSIFDDDEYKSTGAKLLPTGSWIDAPSDHIIVGLKELPEEDFPLKHTVFTST